MPAMSPPSDTMCKCPACGADLKMNLSKQAPTMPSKSPGMPQMDSTGEDDSTDMAGMIDQAASKY